jgi:hypothetical protein
MDAVKLQSKIYGGYSKAASRIGYMTDVYAPSTAANPLDQVNKVRSIFASFNAEDMKYSKPNKYGHPIWYGLFDGSQTQVGNYLNNNYDGTFFIAAQQQALPILLVQCNTIVNVLRVTQQSAVGAIGYGGDTALNELPLMTQWPCSILKGSKGDKSLVGLPGDTRDPWFEMLLPYFNGVTLRSSDIVTDDLARNYVISSAELTDLGWRCTIGQAQT